MPPDLYYEILGRIDHRIRKQDTRFRHALEPGLKLAVVLRHLATGMDYPSLQFDFRISRHSISQFLQDVCQAIIDEFAPEVIKCPVREDDWMEVAEGFKTRWNLPHACGALDGKHVAIRCPPNSGSQYYNYKKFYSVVLMALVDSDYKFLWVDVGADGRASDGQIFNVSELKECLVDGSINLPDAEPLPNDDRDFPYFLVGDDAFALRSYMMKPYGHRELNRAQRIFNYRLSRGRRVVENAFGIMASRWRCLLHTLCQGPEVVRTIVETCVVLHNLMRLRFPGIQNRHLDVEDADHNIIPGDWRNDAAMHEVEDVRAPNRDTREAKQQREYLKLYFNSPAGSVPWQERIVPGAPVPAP